MIVNTCAAAGFTNSNYYDVTAWPHGDAHADIGAVINDIIASIKAKQAVPDHGENEGKPGATIFIPAGDYHLKTQIKIDISYLRLEGAGHGFISSSIRYNTAAEELRKYHDIWPGGSRILIDLPYKAHAAGQEEKERAAILIERAGAPRLSSIELSSFCLDGLHFTEHDSTDFDENTYVNGKTGVYVASACDSMRITDLCVVYAEHGMTIYEADALAIDNNFIAECGNCIELRGCGQASKVSNNLLGAGYNGHTIYAENYGGLLIAANNVFPRGRSSIHLKNVARSSISANRLHSFYSGQIILEGECTENLISGNHLLRDREPWAPMQGYDNGIADDYGQIHIEGSNNSVMSNHLSFSIGREYLKPGKDYTGSRQDFRPVIIRVAYGRQNYLACNHIVATTEEVSEQEQPAAAASACFATQVEAMTRISRLQALPVIAVKIDPQSYGNSVFLTASAREADLDMQRNAFMPCPEVPQL